MGLNKFTDSDRLAMLLSRTKKQASGCIVWTGGLDGRGYGDSSYRGKNMKAHRLSYLLSVGPIPPGKFILHSCDNPPCVNPKHLRPGSARENIHDSITKGRWGHGLKRRSVLLTENDVREIRRKHKAGMKFAALAREYGVGPDCVGKIAHRRTWADVV